MGRLHGIDVRVARDALIVGAPCLRGPGRLGFLSIMSATLRTGAIRRRRKRQEKRNKLRARLANATSAERPALEARLQKTYPLLASDPRAQPHAEPRVETRSAERPRG
jgi:hypothetical protein